MSKSEISPLRWRLILGRYAQRSLNPAMNSESRRMERALDFLYGREYSNRGMRQQEGQRSGQRGPGSLDASQLSVPQWLSEVRELFPRETIEVVEKHALDRYGIDELVTDKECLEKLEPSQDLLRMLLTFKGHMKGDVLATARRLISQIVDELKQRLAREIRQALSGRLNQMRHSPLKVSQNFDWRGTLRANLKNYDLERRQVILDQLLFFSRMRRQVPWQIVLCVDQSGSMVDSVIHSAIIAGILSGLPALGVKLVVFDTSVVDLSDSIDDPVEVLMSVQLGGGTDIAQAVRYCERLIEYPQRTIFALITDFCEGAPPRELLAASKRLIESGVTCIGIAALDQEAVPSYDEQMAGKLAALGMEIAATTPKEFAQWIASKIS